MPTLRESQINPLQNYNNLLESVPKQKQIAGRLIGKGNVFSFKKLRITKLWNSIENKVKTDLNNVFLI